MIGALPLLSRLLLATLAATLLGGCLMARLYREPLGEDSQILELTTDDGWRLALVRYAPQLPARGAPVLFVPGVINNGRAADIDREHSLARFFAAQGRDTYVLYLRGTSLSDKPDSRAGRGAVYNIDTLVSRDVAAAVRRVREHTGAEAVDLVGHSMGGHLIYIYLALGGQGVNAAAVLGAQGRFLTGGRTEAALVRFFVGMASMGETVPAPAIMDALFPIHGTFEGPLEKMGRSTRNVTSTTWRKFMANAVAETSGQVFAQLEKWAQRDRMCSFDGSIDYTALLATVRVPVLVIAGKIDAMAPATQVRAGYEMLGGPKRFLVAGEENGFASDYGHGDLVMADRAAVELWPRIESFFGEHDAARRPDESGTAQRTVRDR